MKRLSLQLTLELLAEDAFHPQLKTHKLKASWLFHGRAVRAMIYVWFSSSSNKGAEAILLESVGSHDEVY